MERSMIELDVEELKRAIGGTGENASYENSLKMMKKFVNLCLKYKRTYDDALRLAVFAYGDDLTETEIRDYVKTVYGK